MGIILGISGLADCDRNRGNLDWLWPSLDLFDCGKSREKSPMDCRYGDLNQVWVAVKGGGGRCTSCIEDRKDFVWNLLEGIELVRVPLKIR